MVKESIEIKDACKKGKKSWSLSMEKLLIMFPHSMTNHIDVRREKFWGMRGDYGYIRT